jgi:cell division protein FtsL
MTRRGALAALAAALLVAGMFVSVHRGARGREIEAHVAEIGERRLTAGEREAGLRQEIERLRSRARITREAERLGMHVPGDSELVYLDLSRRGTAGKARS